MRKMFVRSTDIMTYMVIFFFFLIADQIRSSKNGHLS